MNPRAGFRVMILGEHGFVLLHRRSRSQTNTELHQSMNGSQVGSGRIFFEI